MIRTWWRKQLLESVEKQLTELEFKWAFEWDHSSKVHRQFYEDAKRRLESERVRLRTALGLPMTDEVMPV